MTFAEFSILIQLQTKVNDIRVFASNFWSSNQQTHHSCSTDTALHGFAFVREPAASINVQLQEAFNGEF